MIPLLLAQLPEIGYIIAACLVLAFMAAVGGGLALKFGRDLRTGLADELRLAITASREAASVRVQEPLVTTPEVKFMSRDDCQALHERVETELARHSAARRGIYEKIDEQSNRLTRVEEKTDAQTRQLFSLDQKMDQVLLRLPRS